MWGCGHGAAKAFLWPFLVASKTTRLARFLSIPSY